MKEYFDKLYAQGTQDFYKIVEDSLINKKRMFIVTANPETFSYGEKEKDFDKLLVDKSTTLIPDGIGIVKAARMLDYNITERITGVDLAQQLFNLANKYSLKVALLGATEEVIKALENVFKEKYPKAEIVAIENGYTDNKDKFFDDIAKKEPDVCLVALGIPAQEKLIYKHLSKFKKGIFVGVGGSFDVLSGTKKRAPKIFQKLNIEWLFRLVCEPKRIKRFWNNNVKFILKVKRQKRKNK